MDKPFILGGSSNTDNAFCKVRFCWGMARGRCAILADTSGDCSADPGVVAEKLIPRFVSFLFLRGGGVRLTGGVPFYWGFMIFGGEHPFPFFIHRSLKFCFFLGGGVRWKQCVVCWKLALIKTRSTLTCARLCTLLPARAWRLGEETNTFGRGS